MLLLYMLELFICEGKNDEANDCPEKHRPNSSTFISDIGKKDIETKNCKDNQSAKQNEK